MNNILTRAQSYVSRKYTATADERQKARGLSYVTAEVDDLAREFARFAATEINLDRREQSAGSSHGYGESRDR